MSEQCRALPTTELDRRPALAEALCRPAHGGYPGEVRARCGPLAGLRERLAAGLRAARRRAFEARHDELAEVESYVTSAAQRPLELCEPALPALLVAGVQAGGGWRVWISATAPGPHIVSAAEARRLAGELVQFAELVEQGSGG